MLDHLVFAGPDLAAAVELVRDLLGVEPARGGSHVGLGTANYLVGLGDGAYLEVIGPDPDQPEPDGPRPFGIDGLDDTRVVTWAARVTDVDAVAARAIAGGHDPGPAREMSRATPEGLLLEWRLTAPPPRFGGVVPFLIDWGATPHPTERPLPGTRLVSLSATHPQPSTVGAALTALDLELEVRPGNRAALVAVLEGARGPVVLS